ncbi:membrane-anchored protein [Rhizobium leguminosarum]|nr:membrane-anchored protein [Rhizobium ruizarguesonis]NEJ39769.1 membrane-anchored protein [Rhizobium ruizarguesonis]
MPLVGPVVVVGSAPKSHKPIDLDATYRIISVNASQLALQSWGVDAPDITLMGYNEIEGTNRSAVEVRRVLRGKRTGFLYVLAWRHGHQRLEEGVKAFGYGFEEAHIVDRYQRIALMHKVTGRLNLELDAETKCSNGIIAALFALYNGATAVILSGINPHSAGHVYNGVNLARLHVRMDAEILARLVQLGYPVYTADPQVSEDIGLPLWQGIG